MSSALSVGLTLSTLSSQVVAMQLAMPSITVQNASLSWGDWGCPCVGIDGSVGNMNLSINGEIATYPANLGTSCEAWDDGRYPDACGSGGDPGKGKGFCAQKWCYVDPCTCNKARETTIYMKGSTFKGRPLYYSYDTCEGTDTFTVRDEKEEGLLQEAEVHQSHHDVETNGPEDKKKKKNTEKAKHNKSTSGRKAEDGDNDSEEQWTLAGRSIELQKVCTKPLDEKVVGSRGCRCIGIKHKDMKWEAEVNISNKIYHYPSDIGNYCAAWDSDVHPECRKGSKEKASWCNSAWCYVDPCTCPLYSTKVSKESAYIQKARFEGHPLYYSYQACGESDTWSFSKNVDACTNRKTESDCSGDCKWKKEESACFENTISSYCDVKINRMDAWQASKPDLAGDDKPWWQFW